MNEPEKTQQTAIELECIVCKHRYTIIPDEELLKEMATYCPNCNVKITLEGINTTMGLVIVGYIPNSVVNEHIAKMKDKDWKKKRGMMCRSEV